MNYRHAFHAGNFADVLKHAVLTLILVHLRQKPAAFRVIDIHAGAGLYDLAGDEAQRTGEWREGIGRLQAGIAAPGAAALLAPYLDAIASRNGSGALTLYPGSPLLALALMRPQDRLVACELDPAAARALSRALGRDPRAKAVAIDGWTALNAYVPPPERRGVVLIDPPYEQAEDWERIETHLIGAHRKWPTGIYLLWYPIKDRPATDAIGRRLAENGLGGALRAELAIAPHDPARLHGAGLIVVNAPWTLARDLQVVLPELASTLAQERPGGFRLGRLDRQE